MRLVLFCVAVAAVAACVLPTEGRNPRCIYPGDTIAVMGPYRNEKNEWACLWLMADHVSCDVLEPGLQAGRVTASDCVIPKG